METIEQKLNDYVWDNLNELKSVFSEKVYNTLLEEKEDYDEERFKNILEIIIETNPKILKEIKKQYSNIENMTVEEIIEKLDDFDFESFLNKEIYIKKALKILESDIEKNDYFISLSNLLAEYFISIKEYDKAESYFVKALKTSIELKVENGDIYNSDIVNSYNNIAELYIILKKYMEAEKFLLKALKIQKQKNSLISSWTYHEIAKKYQMMNRNKDAEEFYLKALDKMKKEKKEKKEKNNFYDYFHQKLLYDFEQFKQQNKSVKGNKDKLFFLNSTNSELQLKIDKIKIQNFKQYQNFSINFSKHINIIIGQNAIGKTTLLQAIALGLLKDDSSDIDSRKYHTFIKKNQNESKIIIYHNDEEKKVEIKNDKREIEKNYFIPFLLAYGSNFFTSKTNEVKEVAENIVKHTIHKGFTTSIFMDYTNGFVNPIRLLEFLDLEKDESVPEIQKTFIETINSFLEGFELKAVDKNYYFQKKGSTEKLKLEELSEGYRGNVLLITDMLIKILGVGEKPETIDGIVLIDEFDKHLHPRWQSKLVAKLVETFPKIQFIMTTHNPMSVLDRESDEITMLKEIDGDIVAVRGGGTKTIDVSTILLEYFGVKSTVSESMQKKISRFNILKVQKELSQKEEEELKNLKEFLGNTVASNLIYNRPYLEFLKFLKKNEDITFESYAKLTDSRREELLEKFKDLFDD